MKRKDFLRKTLVITMLSASVSWMNMPLNTMAATDGTNQSTQATVIPATAIDLQAPAEKLTVGTPFQLTSTITPENATNKKVTWTSSDETVATVSPDPNDTTGLIGLVTPLKEGKAEITVKLADNTSIEKKITIEVQNKVATPSLPSRGSGSTRPSNSVYSGNTSSVNTTNSNVLTGSWVRDSTGWWFRTNNGYPRNRWALINNRWYYFGNDGYMRTGWLQNNNAWYYLNHASEGVEGSMRTGWLYDPSYRAWFYLDRSGAMSTGWVYVNGAWYYLNPISDGRRGAMAANTWIGNYYVGADGAWIQGRTR